MNINFETRYILSRTPALEVFITEKWSALRVDSKESDIKRMLLEKASSRLSHEFARYILEQHRSYWEVRDEHDGLKLRMVAYAFSRQQLAEILEDTWLAGQRSGLYNRSINPFQSEQSSHERIECGGPKLDTPDSTLEESATDRPHRKPHP